MKLTVWLPGEGVTRGNVCPAGKSQYPIRANIDRLGRQVSQLGTASRTRPAATTVRLMIVPRSCAAASIAQLEPSASPAPPPAPAGGRGPLSPTDTTRRDAYPPATPS